jgi:uncharacterized protein (TIGR02058 family)
MAMKRVAVEFGMGTDIRGADYTKAAVRALRDALWHNSLSVAKALGMPTDSMVVEILIGVPKPERVDKAAVLAVLPHGTGTVKVVEGGLEIANDEGTDATVIANAAAVKASMPLGQVTVNVVKGGLDLPAEDGHDLAVIASAAIAVRFEAP